ncbi:hypothetical protein C2E23DRAFT_158484 [Lenzites betulinus]|nr:hypothetical protein C2E23DRAFT_158484 [Lenzites betulinus]
MSVGSTDCTERTRAFAALSEQFENAPFLRIFKGMPDEIAHPAFPAHPLALKLHGNTPVCARSCLSDSARDPGRSRFRSSCALGLCAHTDNRPPRPGIATPPRGNCSAFRLLWVDFMCVHRGSLIAPSFLNRFICSSPDPGGIRSRALVLSTPSPQPPILLSAACSVSAVASRRRHSTPRDLFRRFSPRCCPPSSDGVYFSKSHTC